MIVEEIEDLTITNDGATILKQIEITHPATKFTANQVPVTYRHWDPRDHQDCAVEWIKALDLQKLTSVRLQGVLPY